MSIHPCISKKYTLVYCIYLLLFITAILASTAYAENIIYKVPEGFSNSDLSSPNSINIAGKSIHLVYTPPAANAYTLKQPPTLPTEALTKQELENLLWPNPAYPLDHNNLIDQLLLAITLNSFQPDLLTIPMNTVNTAVTRVPGSKIYNAAIIDSYKPVCKNTTQLIQREFTQLISPIIVFKNYSVDIRTITEYPEPLSSEPDDCSQPNTDLDPLIVYVANQYIKYKYLSTTIGSCIKTYAATKEDLGTSINKMTYNTQTATKDANEAVKPSKVNRTFDLVKFDAYHKKVLNFRLGCSSALLPRSWNERQWNGWDDIHKNLESLLKNKNEQNNELNQILNGKQPPVEYTESQESIVNTAELTFNLFNHWNAIYLDWKKKQQVNINNGAVIDTSLELPDTKNMLDSVMFPINTMADTYQKILIKLLNRRYRQEMPDPINILQLTQTYYPQCTIPSQDQYRHTPLDETLYHNAEEVQINQVAIANNPASKSLKNNLDNLLTNQVQDPNLSIDIDLNENLYAVLLNGKYFVFSDSSDDAKNTTNESLLNQNRTGITFRTSSQKLKNARNNIKTMIASSHQSIISPRATLLISTLKDIWATNMSQFNIYETTTDTNTCQPSLPVLENYQAMWRLKKSSNLSSISAPKDTDPSLKQQTTMLRQQAYMQAQKLQQLQKLSLKLDEMLATDSISLLNSISFIDIKNIAKRSSIYKKPSADRISRYIKLYRNGTKLTLYN